MLSWNIRAYRVNIISSLCHGVSRSIRSEKNTHEMLLYRILVGALQGRGFAAVHRQTVSHDVAFNESRMTVNQPQNQKMDRRRWLVVFGCSIVAMTVMVESSLASPSETQHKNSQDQPVQPAPRQCSSSSSSSSLSTTTSIPVGATYYVSFPFH